MAFYEILTKLMIVSRTPYRISFFGGGTDYPAWYREHGGAVLTMAIDKYLWITCRPLPPFFSNRYLVVYSQVEATKTIEEIQHASAREVLKFTEVQEGLRIHCNGDLPARSGIGSSSCFTVAFLNTLYAFQGRLISKHDLAAKAHHVEQDILKEAVGSQDQISAAYGGFNRIDFKQDSSFEVSPIVMDPSRKKEFLGHLMLFYTGIVRTAATIATSKIENFGRRKSELDSIRQMVDQAHHVFQSGASLLEIGNLLHESWMLKRSLSDRVSNPEIDEIYSVGRAAGAEGGKILGAGGGGFILFFVRPELQPKVREALRKLIHVPFGADDSGSKIVLYEPQLSWR